MSRFTFSLCLQHLCLITFSHCSLLGFATTYAATASDQFQELLDDAWETGLREDPLFATSVGDRRFNALLPEVGLAETKEQEATRRRWRERLEAIDSTQLSAGDRVNYQIFGRLLWQELQEYEFRSYLMPISNRSGFHIYFPDMRERVPLKNVEDFENYIARLNAFDRYTAGYIELMREGVRAGITQPAAILGRYREPIEQHIVDDPESSLFFEPLRAIPASVSEAEQGRLQEAAKQAIQKGVVAGYKRFLRFMESEYVPACRGTIGASALPKGRDFYRFRTIKFTTLDETTPEEVHARGQSEVKRIRAEMEAIIRMVGFDGSFAEFVADLRTSPEHFAKTEEELLQVTSLALKRMDGALPQLFQKLPRMPYGLKPIPDYIAPATTSAYYQRPSGDGTKSGTFFLNTYNLPSRPLYAIESLALHEAVPGHHLQIALQQELEDLPNFRKYSNFTVFIEGWALYAERLGLECGFYEDPYSDFGRLSMEIWRACRLVVDTGIHYMGWTRDEAIEFLLANSAMSRLNIEAEVDRYIGWPGQAIAYKTGELKIRELRAHAEEQLGSEFDVREFHDVVLSGGAVPLDVLEARIEAWLQGK